MSDIDDILSDIVSIVSSVRPREVMSLKRIDDDYRAIYNKSIPFNDFGYSSLLELLKDYPHKFQCFMSDGILNIRSNVRNNITALISKEKKSNKPKNFQLNPSQSAPVIRKFRVKEVHNQTDLPETYMRGLRDVVNSSDSGIPKNRLMARFRQYMGYDCKYRDYGYANEDELFQYLNGRVLSLRGDMACPITIHGLSLAELIVSLLDTKTGYTLASLQQADSRIPTLVQNLVGISFNDVISDARTRGILTCDQHFIYKHTDRQATRAVPYPNGVSEIRVVLAMSPSEFYFEILANDSLPARSLLHNDMQRLAPNEPLLAMFAKDNRLCSLEHNGQWYRARITDVGLTKVTAQFIDFGLSLVTGETVLLPTARLRYVPNECERVPAYFHRGALAYVSAPGAHYSEQCCDVFNNMVNDNSNSSYRGYLVADNVESVIIDLIVTSRDTRSRCSVFQKLVAMGLAQSTL